MCHKNPCNLLGGRGGRNAPFVFGRQTTVVKQVLQERHIYLPD